MLTWTNFKNSLTKIVRILFIFLSPRIADKTAFFFSLVSIKAHSRAFICISPFISGSSAGSMPGPAVRAYDCFTVAVPAEVEQLVAVPACLIVICWFFPVFCSFDLHFFCPPYTDVLNDLSLQYQKKAAAYPDDTFAHFVKKSLFFVEPHLSGNPALAQSGLRNRCRKNTDSCNTGAKPHGQRYCNY